MDLKWKNKNTYRYKVHSSFWWYFYFKNTSIYYFKKRVFLKLFFMFSSFQLCRLTMHEQNQSWVKERMIFVPMVVTFYHQSCRHFFSHVTLTKYKWESNDLHFSRFQNEIFIYSAEGSGSHNLRFVWTLRTSSVI